MSSLTWKLDYFHLFTWKNANVHFTLSSLPCTDVPGEGSCLNTAAPLSLSHSTYGRWVWERKLSICGSALWRTPPAFSKLCSGKVLSVLHPPSLSHSKSVLVPIRESYGGGESGLWTQKLHTHIYLHTYTHTETKHNIMENPLKNPRLLKILNFVQSAFKSNF